MLFKWPLRRITSLEGISKTSVTMAEATLAIVPLFSNALDWFRLIRVARSADSDIEICQLRLDIAGLRLLRWGKSANLDTARNDPSTIRITEQERKLCEKTLEQIDKLFRNAKGSAHGITTTPSDQNTFELDEGFKTL